MTRPLSWIAAAAFAILSIGPSAALAASASPVGQWQVTTGEARYAVSSCGSGLCAKLVWLRSDAKTKENTQNKHKKKLSQSRNRPQNQTPRVTPGRFAFDTSATGALRLSRRMN